MAKVRRVLKAVPLVDGHNDLPWYIRELKQTPHDVDAYDLRKHTSGNTDIPRLRQGMVGGQFWSVYIPGEMKDSGYARMQLEEIDIAKRVIAKYPDVFQPAYTAADVRRAHAAGKIGSLLGLEGGHAIENSLGALRAYYALGARYMTLTHNVTLDWADAALDSAKHGGLTNFGKEVVREMNRLGMLVDLSHVSPGTMSDALDAREAPIIFSHSSARALTDVPRNVPDSILARLPKNGGVVMVAFVPGFVSQKIADHAVQRSAAEADARKRFPRDSAAAVRALADWDKAHPRPKATVKDVADHVEHVRKIAGVDHVGIGSDFDGTDNDLPEGLEDVSKFPALLIELSHRGWSEADLRKVAGENVLRALARAEVVARRLQKERPASNKTIQELDGKTKM
ncbi:MAG TPA: dipeptidase [Dehalococcoidia bacterium]|nr:dipeptidase [Dehalococcoidia bacterium]